MKFRYLIVDLIDGSVVGVNKDLSQEELDDDYYTVIDLASFQSYNPTSNEWQAVMEPVMIASNSDDSEAGKETK